MERQETDRNIGFLVNDLSRLIANKYNRVMKPMALTRSQWRVFVHLHRNDGLTQSQLAGLLMVGKVTIGGLIDRLEEQDWVQRRDDLEDRRKKRVFLTDKGRDIGTKMEERGRELTEQALSDLNMDEREQLIDLLFRVKTSLLEIEKDVI